MGKWKEEYEMYRNDLIFSNLKDKFVEGVLTGKVEDPLEVINLCDNIESFLKSENPKYAKINEKGAEDLRSLNKFSRYLARKAIEQEPQLMLRYIERL